MFKYLPSPFPHAIADNFFTEEELPDVWSELKYISKCVGGPEITASARDENGNFKKKNLGVFVDSLYTNRALSPILTFTSKMFTKENLDYLCASNFVFNYLPVTNADSTLVQFYANGDYYKSHKDITVFTITIMMHKEPKKFQGGQLVFTDYGYELDLQNNQAVLFPSFVEHEVKEVVCPNVDINEGRITLSKFISFKPEK